MPSATRVKYVDGKINYGRGRGAQVVGQTFSVYRVTPRTSGQVISGKPLFVNFPAVMTKTKQAIENEELGAIVFDTECNNTKLHIGDVLVETGYRTDLGTYVVADMRPLKPTFTVRCEQAATVTRPFTTADGVTLNPSTPTIVDDYSGVTKGTELILTLTNGQYAFSGSGQSATVPFGLQPTHKFGEYPPSKLPMDTKREVFVGFLPFLLGVLIEENDVISSGSAGDRYRVTKNYIAEQGLQGQILILEKLTV